MDDLQGVYWCALLGRQVSAPRGPMADMRAPCSRPSFVCPPGFSSRATRTRSCGGGRPWSRARRLPRGRCVIPAPLVRTEQPGPASSPTLVLASADAEHGDLSGLAGIDGRRHQHVVMHDAAAHPNCLGYDVSFIHDRSLARPRLALAARARAAQPVEHLSTPVVPVGPLQSE
eukprot:4866115-Prymnesium_polylepis.1